MNHEELHGIHRQLLSLERAVRHTRLSIGSLLTDVNSGNRDFGLRAMPSGLASLLEARRNLSARSVAPFESFAPGVRVTFPSGGRGNQIAVTQFCFDAVPGVSEFASTVGIDVNLDKKDPASWVNLETDLDIDRMSDAGSLRLSLAVSFRSGPNIDLGRYGLALRAHAGGDHHDYFVRKFPAFEVPIEVTYEIQTEDYAPIPWRDYERVSVVVDLPAGRAMSYRLYLSHFEVQSHDR